MLAIIVLRLFLALSLQQEGTAGFRPIAPSTGGVEEQQAFYKLLYSGVEDIDDLQYRMVQKQEEFAKQAAWPHCKRS